jgi:drug/metabolite transporter (DMT)-like permease
VIPLTALLATGAFLGVSTNLAKLADGVGLNPLAFLTWSVVGATAILVGINTARGRLPPFNARSIEYFAVAGLVSIAAPNLLSFAAVPNVGAGFVTLSISFPPLFTYLGALALGMERFQISRAAGVTLALGGAVLLAVYKLSEPDIDPFWVVVTLTAPVVLAIGNIYRTARWPDGAAPDELAPGMLAASAFLLLAIGAVTGSLGEGTTQFSLAVPMDRAGPMVVILAQTATFSCMYLLYFVLQKYGGPVYFSLLGSVAAVVGVPIAVFVLGEGPPRGLAIGGVLIAIGVGLLTFGHSEEIETSQPSPDAE